MCVSSLLTPAFSRHLRSQYIVENSWLLAANLAMMHLSVSLSLSSCLDHLQFVKPDTLQQKALNFRNYNV